MPLYLSPVCNDQMLDVNGDPLSGGMVETYIAGSSTPTATYTSSAGTVQQANPIILNSLGYAPSPIWLAAGVAYKFVIKDALGATLRTIDDVRGVNDASVSQSEWVNSGVVATYIGATSFSVPGDQTSVLHVGRRLRTTNTAGTIYSTISTSVYSAGVTTVTVANDSGTLDAGLADVAYGLLSYLPSSHKAATSARADTAGNADTATKLATARTIGGVSFDGSANINLPGVNTTGNQNTTGNAATVTTLTTGQVRSALADSYWGEVGTYALLRRNASASPNNLIAGSELFTAGLQRAADSVATVQSDSVVSGTWRCLSYAPSSGTLGAVGLYIRVS